MLTKNTTVGRPCLCWQYAAQAPPPPPPMPTMETGAADVGG